MSFTDNATEVMTNKPQHAMDHDFLEGIDEQFQKLMKLYGNGKRNGRSGRNADDPLILEILSHLHGLSRAQQEELLAYILTLKQKVE
jgi:hypothetical protein